MASMANCWFTRGGMVSGEVLRELVNRMSSIWFSSRLRFIQGRTVLSFAMLIGKWRPDLESPNSLKMILPIIYITHMSLFSIEIVGISRGFPCFFVERLNTNPASHRPIGIESKASPWCCLLQALLKMIHDPQRIAVNESWWMSTCSLRICQNSEKKKHTANRQCSQVGPWYCTCCATISCFRPMNQGWRHFFLVKTISM